MSMKKIITLIMLQMTVLSFANDTSRTDFYII